VEEQKKSNKGCAFDLDIQLLKDMAIKITQEEQTELPRGNEYM